MSVAEPVVFPHVDPVGPGARVPNAEVVAEAIYEHLVKLFLSADRRDDARRIIAEAATPAEAKALVESQRALLARQGHALPLAVRYARIIFVGLIAMEMVPSMGYMLNAAGAPQVMLGMTVVGTLALLVSEPFLVPWLDVEGAALALVAMICVTAIALLFIFFNRKNGVNW